MNDDIKGNHVVNLLMNILFIRQSNKIMSLSKTAQIEIGKNSLT